MATSLSLFPSDIGFTRYLQEIRRIPSLALGEEIKLANKYIQDQDLSAAHKLVTSHLKLVVKVAATFKGYGLPMIELVSEGNIGLMQAVKKFDPNLGFRLSTYAVWWIKASIQEYILKSWSLVKIGTTAAQKKLFYSLGKIKNKISAAKNLTQDDVSIIASELNVSEKEVSDMNSRMSGSDISLNYPVSFESSEELIDFLPETKANQETNFLLAQELSRKQHLLKLAMDNFLNVRQKDIIEQRMLTEPAVTLEELSQKYGISRERVRQIEVRALEKLQKAVIDLNKDETDLKN